MLGDLAVAFVGAFLGFVAALLTDGVVRRRRKLRSIDNLLDELHGFITALEPLILTLPLSDEGNHELALALRYRVHLPIWDAIVGTGDLLEFRDKPYFNALIRLYTVILELRARVDGASGSVSHPEVGVDDLREMRNCAAQIMALSGRDSQIGALLEGTRGR